MLRALQCNLQWRTWINLRNSFWINPEIIEIFNKRWSLQPPIQIKDKLVVKQNANKVQLVLLNGSLQKSSVVAHISAAHLNINVNLSFNEFLGFTKSTGRVLIISANSILAISSFPWFISLPNRTNFTSSGISTNSRRIANASSYSSTTAHSMALTAPSALAVASTLKQES